jgi:hypothetical protein
LVGEGEENHISSQASMFKRNAGMYQVYAQRDYAPRIISAEESFYKLTEKLWNGSSKKCNNHSMHRFLTLMRKMGAHTFVEEDLEISNQLLEEQEMASLRCKAPVKLTAKRLSFFCLDSISDWRNKKKLRNEYLLGYAVVAKLMLPNNTQVTYLTEAVTRMHGETIVPEDGGKIFHFLVPNYYLHNVCEHKTTIGQKDDRPRTFKIKGVYFTQQNDLTSVCAHSALKMSVNNSKLSCRKKLSYEKLTDKYINDTLRLDFKTPQGTIGHYEGDAEDTRAGLYSDDIEEVAKSLKCHLMVINFDSSQAADFDQFMYSMVESGYPTILEVQGWDIRKNDYYAHVLTVLGHTLNSDRWEPQAEIGYGNFPIKKYMPSSSWVCHYIINDDNFGMGVTLPSAMVRNDVLPYKNPKLHAHRLMCMTPYLKIDGYRAESIALDIAKGLIRDTEVSVDLYWLKKLKKRNSENQLVTRTLCVRKREYLKYLKEQQEQKTILPSKTQLDYIESCPPHLWVTEISLANLYIGNKAKLGDVVINPKASEKAYENDECCLFAWFPGIFRKGLTGSTTIWHQPQYVPLLPTYAEYIFQW